MCQPAITLLSGHYHCISIVLLTVGTYARVLCMYTHMRTSICTQRDTCITQRQRKRERKYREGQRAREKEAETERGERGREIERELVSASGMLYSREQRGLSTWSSSQTGAGPQGSHRASHQPHAWQEACVITLQRPYYTCLTVNCTLATAWHVPQTLYYDDFLPMGKAIDCHCIWWHLICICTPQNITPAVWPWIIIMKYMWLIMPCNKQVECMHERNSWMQQYCHLLDKLIHFFTIRLLVNNNSI